MWKQQWALEIGGGEVGERAEVGLPVANAFCWKRKEIHLEKEVMVKPFMSQRGF